MKGLGGPKASEVSSFGKYNITKKQGNLEPIVKLDNLIARDRRFFNFLVGVEWGLIFLQENESKSSYRKIKSYIPLAHTQKKI